MSSKRPATIPMAVLEFWPLHGFKAAGWFPVWPIDGKGWTLPGLTLLTPTLPSRLLLSPPPSSSRTDPLKRGLSFTDAAEIIGQTRTSLDPRGQTPSSHSCHSSHFLLFILPSAHAKATPPFVILSHCQQQWAEVGLNPSTSHPLLHSHYRSLTEAAIFPPEHVISPLWRPAGTNYLMLGASLPNQSITLQSPIFQKL